MNPQEVNLWVAFFILGLPIAFVFGGPFIWRAAVILAGLALAFSHPAIFALIAIPWLLWRPLKWLVVVIFFGEGLGLGLRAAGTFGRLSRRPRLPRWTRDELAAHHAREEEQSRRAELARQDDEWRRAPPRSRGREGDYDDTIDMG
jgi:hypothetical protein